MGRRFDKVVISAERRYASGRVSRLRFFYQQGILKKAGLIDITLRHVSTLRGRATGGYKRIGFRYFGLQVQAICKGLTNRGI